jgi:hypothetical protein
MLLFSAVREKPAENNKLLFSMARKKPKLKNIILLFSSLSLATENSLFWCLFFDGHMPLKISYFQHRCLIVDDLFAAKNCPDSCSVGSF